MHATYNAKIPDPAESVWKNPPICYIQHTIEKHPKTPNMASPKPGYLRLHKMSREKRGSRASPNLNAMAKKFDKSLRSTF